MKCDGSSGRGRDDERVVRDVRRLRPDQGGLTLGLPRPGRYDRASGCVGDGRVWTRVECDGDLSQSAPGLYTKLTVTGAAARRRRTG